MKYGQKKNVEAFLRVQGLNNEAITLIVNNKWKTPATWDRGITLQQHIDVPMHLLFLGVVKTCIQMVHEWMSKRHKCATFVKYTRGALESIQALGLSWCKCIPYKTGKLGGWISEIFLAHARLLHWFYGSIDDVAIDQQFIMPSLPQSSWTKTQNSSWLAIRGLDAKGNAVELRDRVSRYMNMEGGPPPVKEQEGGPVRNVQEMLFSLRLMISHIMESEMTADMIKNIERHILLFLNYFDQFDTNMRKSNEKPTWLTSYNFLCLLNLPKTIEEFGPIRNYWEGGVMGEKLIQVVKPLWNGFRKNWQKSIMDKVMKQMAIQRVKNYASLYQEPKGNENEKKGKQIHLYTSAEVLTSDYNSRKPISIMQLNNGKFMAALKNQKYIEVICGAYSGKICGAHYHCWFLSNGQPKSLQMTNHTTRYCLLLPKMTKNGLPSSAEDPIFTAIDSDWNDIQPNKMLMKPTIFSLID